MTISLTPLPDLERSARMFCEAPLCSKPATHRATYTYTLDGDLQPRSDSEFLCDRCAAQLQAELDRARPTPQAPEKTSSTP